MKIISGDIKEILHRDKFAVAHGVNCQGVMASGVAKVIKDEFPIVKDRYLEYHRAEVVTRGKPTRSLLSTSLPVKVKDGCLVFNCFTQDRYGRDGLVYASSTAIHWSLSLALSTALHFGHRELFIPMIGAGLGGLPVVECLEAYIAAEREHQGIELVIVIPRGES